MKQNLEKKVEWTLQEIEKVDWLLDMKPLG